MFAPRIWLGSLAWRYFHNAVPSLFPGGGDSRGSGKIGGSSMDFHVLGWESGNWAVAQRRLGSHFTGSRWKGRGISENKFLCSQSQGMSPCPNIYHRLGNLYQTETQSVGFTAWKYKRGWVMLHHRQISCSCSGLNHAAIAILGDQTEGLVYKDPKRLTQLGLKLLWL